MQGREILGVVRGGDRVRFDRLDPDPRDGTISLDELQNLTRKTRVVVRPPRLRDRLQGLAPAVLSALASSAFGAVSAAVLQNSRPATRGPADAFVTVGIIFAAVLVFALVMAVSTYFIYYRPQQRRRTAVTAWSREAGTAAPKSQATEFQLTGRWMSRRTRAGRVLAVGAVVLSCVLSVGGAYFLALTIHGG